MATAEAPQPIRAPIAARAMAAVAMAAGVVEIERGKNYCNHRLAVAGLPSAAVRISEAAHRCGEACKGK